MKRSNMEKFWFNILGYIKTKNASCDGCWNCANRTDIAFNTGNTASIKCKQPLRLGNTVNIKIDNIFPITVSYQKGGCTKYYTPRFAAAQK